MIKSNYTDDWRLVTRLAVEWPFSQSQVYAALEQEEYFGDGDRTYCHDIKSPILQSIYNTVIAGIPALLAEMSEQNVFQSKWSLDYKEQIINNTVASCHFVKDKPGYNTQIHTDCITQVCTGMLFFNSFDDPEQSTSFCTSPSGDNSIRMSSQYGNGWYAANVASNFHIGANNTQRNRYAILFINKLNLK